MFGRFIVRCNRFTSTKDFPSMSLVVFNLVKIRSGKKLTLQMFFRTVKLLIRPSGIIWEIAIK